jgi:hypothetical protein
MTGPQQQLISGLQSAVQLIGSGEPQRALGQLEVLSRAFGNHPDILQIRGVAFRRLGKTPEAIASFRASLALHDPGQIEEVDGGFRMLGPEGFFVDFNRQSVVFFGILEVECLVVGMRQFVEREVRHPRGFGREDPHVRELDRPGQSRIAAVLPQPAGVGVILRPR